MTIRICLEENQNPEDVQEWVQIEGLTVADLGDVLSAPNGQRCKRAVEILKERGILCPLKLHPEIAITYEAVEAKNIWPIGLIPVSRQQTLASIERRVIGMPVVDTFQTNMLTHRANGAQPNDRFLALAKFKADTRRAENATGVFFVMIEIDDPAVFAAAQDFGPDILPSMAQEHIKAATLALSLFTGKEIPPFLVTYSGKKSFHCLWQFDYMLTQKQSKTCKQAREYMQKHLANKESRTPIETAFLAIDPQPLFSTTALARIPCTVAEPGRFPQIAWRTGHTGVIPSNAIMARCEAIVEKFGAMDDLTHLQRHHWACGIHALRPMMAQGSGSVVNTTSGAQSGSAFRCAYGSASAGIGGLTSAWAAECLASGVRVNAIAPIAATREIEETEPVLRRLHEAGRVGPEFLKLRETMAGMTPAMNAPLVVFLLSDSSARINGQTLRLNGDRLHLVTRPAARAPVLESNDWTVERIAQAFAKDWKDKLLPLGMAEFDMTYLGKA